MVCHIFHTPGFRYSRIALSTTEAASFATAENFKVLSTSDRNPIINASSIVAIISAISYRQRYGGLVQHVGSGTDYEGY